MPLPTGTCAHADLPLAVGNRWVYDVATPGEPRPGTAIVEVVAATPTEITVRRLMEADDDERGEVVQTGTYRCDNGAVKFVRGDAVLGVLDVAPAADVERAGASWSTTTTRQVESGSKGTLSETHQVVTSSAATTSVTVPAGTIAAVPLTIQATVTAGAQEPETTTTHAWLAPKIGLVRFEGGGLTFALRSTGTDNEITLGDVAISQHPRGALISAPHVVPPENDGGGVCTCQCPAGKPCQLCPVGTPKCASAPAEVSCPSDGQPGVGQVCDGTCYGGCKKTTHWQLVKGKETVEFVGEVSGGGCTSESRTCATGNCESPHVANTDYCEHHDDRDLNVDIVFPNGNGDQYLSGPNLRGGGEFAGRDLAIEWEWMYAFPGFRSDDWLQRTPNGQGFPLKPRLQYNVDVYPDRPGLPLELGVPWAGDPIAVHGFLILDCGHPDPDNHTRTEVHPPTVLAWTHRESDSTASVGHYTLWLRAAAHATYPRSGDGESWMKGELHQVLPLQGVDLRGKSVYVGPPVYDYILDGYDNKNWCPGGVFGLGGQPFARIRNNTIPYATVERVNQGAQSNGFFTLQLATDPNGVRVALDRARDDGGYPPLIGVHAPIVVCDVAKECENKPCNASVCDGHFSCASVACPGQACSAAGTCCNNSCTNLACGATNGCGEACSTGTCPSGQDCDGGKCVSTAPPTCSAGKHWCDCAETPACMTTAACNKACGKCAAGQVFCDCTGSCLSPVGCQKACKL